MEHQQSFKGELIMLILAVEDLIADDNIETRANLVKVKNLVSENLNKRYSFNDGYCEQKRGIAIT